MTRAFFRFLRQATWCLLLAVAGPQLARAETIYAISPNFASGSTDLLRFDSASPETLEQSMQLSGVLGELASVTLEFDPRTRELYGFAAWSCQILCPPTPIFPLRIDPFTGASESTGWPGFPGLETRWADFDIHPDSSELRFIGHAEKNFRYSLPDLEFTEDVAFDEPGTYRALAHAPPSEPGGGVETFAVVSHPTNELRLARIGGPGGSPPASSGEVSWIGPMVVQGDVAGFDISQGGTAFLSTMDWTKGGFGEVYTNRLYTIDLATGAAHELGVIAVPGPDSLITGIAVAPEGLGPGILEIPSLSPVGIGFLAIALACAALVYLSASRRFGQSVGEGPRRCHPPGTSLSAMRMSRSLDGAWVVPTTWASMSPMVRKAAGTIAAPFRA